LLIARSIDKMATEINRNMLCQLRILLLTRKGSFPILSCSLIQDIQDSYALHEKVRTKRFFDAIKW